MVVWGVVLLFILGSNLGGEGPDDDHSFIVLTETKFIRKGVFGGEEEGGGVRSGPG